jgi:hypothetical protein
MSTIIAQYFEIKEVGATIKRFASYFLFINSTKKQYIWRLSIDGKISQIEMFTSFLSGKKKIVLNG